MTLAYPQNTHLQTFLLIPVDTPTPQPPPGRVQSPLQHVVMLFIWCSRWAKLTAAQFQETNVHVAKMTAAIGRCANAIDRAQWQDEIVKLCIA